MASAESAIHSSDAAGRWPAMKLNVTPTQGCAPWAAYKPGLWPEDEEQPPPSQRFQPARAKGTSPPIHRWGKEKKAIKSRQGRQNPLAAAGYSLSPGVGPIVFFRPCRVPCRAPSRPRGLPTSYPTVESVGYFLLVPLGLNDPLTLVEIWKRVLSPVRHHPSQSAKPSGGPTARFQNASSARHATLILFPLRPSRPLREASP